MDDVKQVIVARRDLGMRKGKLAAQVAHASLGTLTMFLTKSIISGSYKFYPPEEMIQWLNDSFVKVVVGCNTEEELLELKRRAEELKLINKLITDNGTTEFHGVPTKTCLAIGPGKNYLIDKVTRHLRLL